MLLIVADALRTDRGRREDVDAIEERSLPIIFLRASAILPRTSVFVSGGRLGGRRQSDRGAGGLGGGAGADRGADGFGGGTGGAGGFDRGGQGAGAFGTGGAAPSRE